MDEVFIIDAIRTPIGSFMGQYKKIESVNLGISCIEGIFDRNKNIEKKSKFLYYVLNKRVTNFSSYN